MEPSPMFAATAPERGDAGPSRLHLRFSCHDDATRMFVSMQQPPWRAIRAFTNSQRQALVHLHNVSGGILAGDSLHLAVDAEAGARVQVTSIGATRIYRHRPGRSTAGQSTVVNVGDDAMVEYLPDAVIPFAGSRFSQSTTVSLGRNAGFIGWETIAAGRVASGEEFAFDFFHSDYSVFSGEIPIALERWSLAPAAIPLQSAARWGRFKYTTTMYVCRAGVAQSRWLDLETRLNLLATAKTSSCERWGVSTLVAEGLVVRGMALEAHGIVAGLQSFWECAKEKIWNEAAIAPRKMN